MAETARSHPRRSTERYFDFWITGRGIDIGCGDDPVTPTCEKWDQVLGHGDAAKMEGVPSGVYDFVFSSHCLEDMEDPTSVVARWWELLKEGGHLIIEVPHRDLYERKKELPSNGNGAHRWFWLPDRAEPPCTLNLLQVVQEGVGARGVLMSLRTLAAYRKPYPDEFAAWPYSIEIVMRKGPLPA